MKVGWLSELCGGVDYTDSVFRLSLKCIGSGRESRFLVHNFLADQSPGVVLWTTYMGDRRA